MNHHGIPVRLGFVGSTGSTSVAISLIIPGSANTPYNFLPTDTLYITSLVGGTATSTGGAVTNSVNGQLLAAAAGASTAFSSTLLFSWGLVGSFTDVGSEALACPQGVIPSILQNQIVSTSGLGNTLFLSGCGFVVNAPAVTRPAFMNAQVPTG
jgi:hypothetical protein